MQRPIKELIEEKYFTEYLVNIRTSGIDVIWPLSAGLPVETAVTFLKAR